MRMPGGAKSANRREGEVEPIDRLVLVVAEEERTVAVEGKPKRETSRPSYEFDTRGIRSDTQDLAVFAAAPEPAVRAHGNALRMLQPRLREDSIEEDRGALNW